MLKLLIVTDIHHGKNSLTKRGDQALPLMTKLHAFCEQYQPDALIDLGDRITDADRESDRQTLAELAEAFSAFEVPRFHIVGNHDCEFMTRADNEEILNCSMQHRSVELAGWRLLFWQAAPDMQRPIGPAASRADLQWLVQELSNSSLPTVVFSHIPLDDGSMRSNYYFQENARYARYGNSQAITDVIQQHGRVALCVAGHVHWNSLARVSGIPFVTVQSLTESFTNDGDAAGAWATLELDQSLHWQTHGHDAIEVKVPLGGGNKRWMKPLPAFETMRGKHRASNNLDIGDIKGLIVDLDGTLYRGSEPIDGAPQFIRAASEAGMAICVLTNNSRLSAAQQSAKLAAMDIHIEPSNIVSSADAVATMLSKKSPNAKIHLVANENVRDAVLKAGALESDQPDFVISAFDPTLRVSELGEAVAHLSNGAQLLTTNRDDFVALSAHREPENGAIVAFLEAAAGVRAQVAGKPTRAIFDTALARLGCEREAVLVVGDNLQTDVVGAAAAGMRSALIESGVSRVAGQALTQTQPDYRLSDLHALMALLRIG